MTVYYCSGPIDLTEDEFKQYYIPRLYKIINSDENYKFIMGVAPGADLMCFRYLINLVDPELITIFPLSGKKTMDIHKEYPAINIINPAKKTKVGIIKYMIDISDVDITCMHDSIDYNSILRMRAIKNIKQRKDWDTIFMEMCYTISQRSTCLRLQTASVIQRNNVVVSIGYNGSVSGAKHCNEHWVDYYFENQEIVSEYGNLELFLQSPLFQEEHHKWSNINELHGESNAIIQAGKNGISLNGATLYTVYSPCISCAKNIIQSGIVKVYYSKTYKRDTTGMEFLKRNHIDCIKI